MLPRSLTGAAFAALFTLPTHVSAALSAQTGYAAFSIYAHTTSDSIISYDWDAAANLHYMTLAGFLDVNIWRTTGSTPFNIYAAPSNFSGASVVAIGDYVYFNDSDFSGTQFIRGYAAAAVAPVVTAFSTTPNFGLYGHNGDLLITGTDGIFGDNQIYFSDLAGDGDLLNDPALNLGTTGGGSGPLAFDLAGNLYYAPGFSDLSIYKFTAAEVAAAIAGTTLLTAASHLWLDYALLYPNFMGATSLLLDAEGDLLATLTNLNGSSALAEFGTGPGGAHDGSNTLILTDSGRIGELRSLNGDIFVSSGNQIYQVVPEPAAALLLALGGTAFALRRRRS